MIVCRKTGEKMSAWKWMARICSKTPWMKTWSLRVYYWWKKLQYQKGYVEKEESNPKKVIFEAYMGKKYACSPKALYKSGFIYRNSFMRQGALPVKSGRLLVCVFGKMKNRSYVQT